MAYSQTPWARLRPDASPARTARFKSRPSLESLEERQLLSTTSGDAWTYPIRVTYSFMPDGTSIGGTPSSLFGTMNGYATTASWQAAIAKAAATWENVAPVNLVQVGDDGSDVGSGPDQQGAPNFGDIRFGAMPEPNGELAFAFLPPPGNGGSTSADIFFNSNVNWGSTGYDLSTVALHEIGHALGLEHSSSGSSAVMWASYTGTKQSLSTDDIGGVQSIYGPRPSTANTSPSSAAAISLGNGGVATINGVQIAAATNQNWYSVVVPQGTTGSLTVTLQSTTLSSLEPRLTLYNSGLQGLAQAATSTFGGTATIALSGVSAGQKYYIRVVPNTNGPGSAGAYGLSVDAGTGTPAPITPPYTTIAAQANQSGGTSAETTSSSGGGLLGGLLKTVTTTVSSVVGTLSDLLDGAVHLIQIGSLSGYAEAYDVSPHARHHAGPGHRHHHPAGPRPHAASFVSRTIG